MVTGRPPSNTNWYQADISESSILITEPYFNLPQIQRIYDQFAFEEYGFQSYYRCTRACIFASQKSHVLDPACLSVRSCIADPPWFIIYRTTQNTRRRRPLAARVHVGHRLRLQLHAHRPAHFGLDCLECCETVCVRTHPHLGCNSFAYACLESTLGESCSRTTSKR